MTCKNGRIGGIGPRRMREHSRGVTDWVGVDVSERICLVDGCERAAWARGWCNAHYTRWNKTGETGPAAIRRKGGKDATCEFAGCGRRHEAHGLCPGHYRQRADGRPLVPLESRRDTKVRDDLGRKQCVVCLLWLPEDSYHRHITPADGLGTCCKPCHRERFLKNRYGMTAAQYDELLAAQGGVCAICGRANEDGRQLAVDHDHSCCPDRNRTCGRCVRGLLCNKCNMGLGYLRDSATLLHAAAEYLQSHGARSG